MKKIVLLLCLFLCSGWSHGRGPHTYYVSGSGNDSNNGLTQTTPWQTTSKVNSSSFNTGDVVAFHGGDIFSGGLNLSDRNAPSSLTITSYGTGQAILTSSGTTQCIFSSFMQDFYITNISCSGTGIAGSQQEGIEIRNPTSSLQRGPYIQNNTISGFGQDCIFISMAGQAAYTGLIYTTISGNTLHDCGGDAAAGHGACAQLYAIPGNTVYLENVDIWFTNNTIYNCSGTAVTGGGSGFFSSGTTLLRISNNLVHDFNYSVSNCPGGAGLIATNDDTALISFNEVYNGSTRGGGCDAEGIDFDIGSKNGIMEYNYAHDNTTADLIVFGSVGLSIVRFNLVSTTVSNGIGIKLGDEPANTEVYNNTIVSQSGLQCVVGDNTAAAVTWTFANNIFVCNNLSPSIVITLSIGGSVINVTGNDYNISGNFGVELQSVTYNSLANMQAAGYEKVGGNPVGSGANANLNGSFPSSACGGYSPPCPNAFQLSSSSPAGKGNGLNLNSIYGFNVGTQDFYGNVLTAGTLPIGAAANK